MNEQAKCQKCGRRLSDPFSVEKGFGPVCARREHRARIAKATSHEFQGELFGESVVRPSLSEVATRIASLMQRIDALDQRFNPQPLQEQAA